MYIKVMWLDVLVVICEKDQMPASIFNSTAQTLMYRYSKVQS